MERMAEAGRHQLLKTPSPMAGWLAGDLSPHSHSWSYLSLSSIRVRLLWVYLSGLVDRLYKGSVASQPKSKFPNIPLQGKMVRHLKKSLIFANEEKYQ